jgi:hypothetical protein
MGELLKKISSYNIVNFLLPGVLFVLLARLICHVSLPQEDIVVALFLYYFVGLVVSRIGSLALEPILRKMSIVRFSDYKDFLDASAADSKLEVLSETNNMYRTLATLFLLLALLQGYQALERWMPALTDWSQPILLLGLIVLFVLSYSKQSRYINQRVQAHKRPSQ